MVNLLELVIKFVKFHIRGFKIGGWIWWSVFFLVEESGYNQPNIAGTRRVNGAWKTTITV